MKKNRRQFLKNASLAFLALGTAPSILARSKNKAGDTNATCNALTEDFYGEGPFYTSHFFRMELLHQRMSLELGC
jgi:hypothetical protein